MSRAASVDELVPRGVSMYVRRIPDAAYGRELAARAADHGLRALFLAMVWQDHRGTVDMVKRAPEIACAEECRRRGVDVWGWGYPDAGQEDAFVAAVREHLDALGLRGPLLDVEKPYRSAAAAARALVRKTLDVMDERHGIGMTSYGNPGMFTPDVAAILAACGWVSPQTYTVEPWVARKHVLAWRELMGQAGSSAALIASVPTYGPNSEGSLGAYLGALEEHVDGFIAWSEPSTSPLEWKTLERWAQRFPRVRIAA